MDFCVNDNNSGSKLLYKTFKYAQVQMRFERWRVIFSLKMNWHSHSLHHTLCFKGLVHLKIKILSVITHPNVVPNLWPSFIFGTQIKIFLMKSESYQTLHRQQHNWNVPSPRNIVNTLVKQSMWHQWLNFSFAMLQEYFFCAKKTKITIYLTILLPRVTSSAILEST